MAPKAPAKAPAKAQQKRTSKRVERGSSAQHQQESIVSSAQRIKRHFEEAVSRCAAGDARKWIARRIILSLLDAFQPSTSWEGDSSSPPLILLGGPNAMKYVVADFDKALETLTTFDSAYLSRDKDAAAWVDSMQKAMLAYDECLDSIGTTMKVTVIPSSSRSSMGEGADKAHGQVVSLVGDALSRVRDEILGASTSTAPASVQASTWQQFRACLAGTDPLLRAPGAPPKKEGSSAETASSTVADLHVSMHTVDRVIPKAEGEGKRARAHVFTLRVGYSTVESGQIAASDLITVTVPMQDDSDARDILRDIKGNTMKASFNNLKLADGQEVHTYNLRSASKHLASVLDAYTAAKGKAPAPGGDGVRLTLKYLQALCHVQMVRCLLDFLRGSQHLKESFGTLAAPQSLVTDAHLQEDAARLQKHVSDRFDAIAMKVQSDWAPERAAASASKGLYAKALDIMHEYKDLSMASMRVLDALMARSREARDSCKSLLAGYDASEVITVDMVGGANKNNGKGKGKGNGGKANGKGRGAKNNQNDTDGKSGNKNQKGKKGSNKTDMDVAMAVRQECAIKSDNEKPERHAEYVRNLTSMGQWYEELEFALADMVKKLIDEDASERNKTVMKCIPLSVKEKLRDIKAFADDLGAYYKPRLQDVFFDAYTTMMSRGSGTSRDVFSDVNGNIFADPRADESSIMANFEAKTLLYNYRNLWGIIQSEFKKLKEEAGHGLASPSPSFRHVYYNVNKRQFWFLWTTNVPQLKNSVVTVVTMAITSKDAPDASPTATISHITYGQALELIKIEPVIRLSQSTTRHMEFKMGRMS